MYPSWCSGRWTRQSIRAYLNSGIMDDGVVQQRHQGTPQGGPLSPLLANVLLDEQDGALLADHWTYAASCDAIAWDSDWYVRPDGGTGFAHSDLPAAIAP